RQSFQSFGNAVSDLTSRIEKEHGVAEGLERLAQTQERVADVLGAQSGVSYGGEETDAEARMRLRSIDVQMLRILEELSAGRQESMSELRGDLAALTREIQKMRGVPV
ncbi:MAG: biopolymer transporter ExbB, partial [Pseudomonadota bacterium]